MTNDEKITQLEQLTERYVQRFDQIKDLPRGEFTRQYVDLIKEHLRESHAAGIGVNTYFLGTTYNRAVRAQVANEDGLTKDEKDYVRMLCDQEEAMKKYPSAVWDITPEIREKMNEEKKQFAEVRLEKILGMLKSKKWEVSGEQDGSYMTYEDCFGFEKMIDKSPTKMIVGSDCSVTPFYRYFYTLTGEGVEYLKSLKEKVSSYVRGYHWDNKNCNEIISGILESCGAETSSRENLTDTLPLPDITHTTVYSILSQLNWTIDTYDDVKKELAKVQEECKANGKDFDGEAIKQHLETRR